MAWVHWRWACPKFLLINLSRMGGDFHSVLAMGESFLRAAPCQGKSRHVAIRALAYKWMRIVFRCWKDRKPYSEVVYTQALTRGPKLGPNGNSIVQFQWKNRAGFSKFTGVTP